MAWFVVLCYLGTAIVCTIVALVAWQKKNDEVGLPVGRWWSLVFAFGTVALGLFVLQLLGSALGYGILRPLIGADRRFSTSKTQLGLWTVAIATGVAFLLGRIMFEGKTQADVMLGDRWEQYLLLLGGPFAAAVASKAITTYKLSNGTLQKSEAAATSGAQVVTSDNGSADLIDAQYLLFNVVAMGYFVVQLASKSVLPEIPETLLALTGGTAAAFVANKAATRNAPTITSVTPMSAKVGTQVRVFGTNFDPADKNDQTRRITVALTGCTETIYPEYSSESEVRFLVPRSATVDVQTLRVTSSAGVETEPHELQVLAGS